MSKDNIDLKAIRQILQDGRIIENRGRVDLGRITSERPASKPPAPPPFKPGKK
jgi:hypothetical protein